MKSSLYFDQLKKIAVNKGIFDEESGKNILIETSFLEKNHVFCTDFNANPNYLNSSISKEDQEELLLCLDPDFIDRRLEDRSRLSLYIENFDDSRDILSIPFDVCSFESNFDKRPIASGEFPVFCVLISEENYKESFVLLLTENGFGQKQVTYSEKKQHVEIWKEILLDTFIKINTNGVFEKRTTPKSDIRPINKRKKAQSKKTKTHPPRKYLYVTNRRIGSETLDDLSMDQKVREYSHCFEVRGHWRKINGVGLNRHGERTVQGATWIRSHLKGKKELIFKSRIVK